MTTGLHPATHGLVLHERDREGVLRGSFPGSSTGRWTNGSAPTPSSSAFAASTGLSPRPEDVRAGTPDPPPDGCGADVERAGEFVDHGPPVVGCTRRWR